MPQASQTETTPSLRALTSRPKRWTSTVPLAFLLFTLVVLAVVPLAGERYTAPYYEVLRAVAEPGRGHVTEIQLALALEGAALHDFIETRSDAAAARYHIARRQEQEAHRQLAPLAARLGGAVQERFDSLRALEARWHAVADAFLSETDAARRQRSGEEEEELYEEVLIAAAHLDQSLGDVIRDRRERIIAVERMQGRLGIVLGVLAFGAVAIVALVARRLRGYATEVEARGRALEEMMESKARFIRGISHDLKNPLNAIEGHATLLAEGVHGEMTPVQRDSVERIRRSGRALLTLIQDLLELSRAEVGELRIQRRPTDIGRVIHDAVEEHRAEAIVSRHELVVEHGDTLPPVATDEARVRQVLGNLLSNAIKYSPPGARISVRSGSRSTPDPMRPGRWMSIDVVDTGHGIPADKLESVFEEFTRLDTTGRPGAGLGLAIARRIARLLGGDITLRSEVGRGSCFTLLLPLDGMNGRT